MIDIRLFGNFITFSTVGYTPLHIYLIGLDR